MQGSAHARPRRRSRGRRPHPSWGGAARPRPRGAADGACSLLDVCIAMAKTFAGDDRARLRILLPVILKENGLPCPVIPVCFVGDAHVSPRARDSPPPPRPQRPTPRRRLQLPRPLLLSRSPVALAPPAPATSASSPPAAPSAPPPSSSPGAAEALSGDMEVEAAPYPLSPGVVVQPLPAMVVVTPPRPSLSSPPASPPVLPSLVSTPVRSRTSPAAVQGLDFWEVVDQDSPSRSLEGLALPPPVGKGPRRLSKKLRRKWRKRARITSPSRPSPSLSPRRPSPSPSPRRPSPSPSPRRPVSPAPPPVPAATAPSPEELEEIKRAAERAFTDFSRRNCAQQ